MTESRYPGLEQANGEHRDSFATRFAGRPHGYDSTLEPDAGPAPGGSPTNGSVAGHSTNDNHGYDPAATQFALAPLESPTVSAPPPVPPARDSGTTRAAGPDGGATRAAPPDFSGYDLSKIGGTTTYGSPAGGGGSGRGGGGASYSPGFSGSVTGYDPANYAPPSSYATHGYDSGSGDGATYRVGRDGSVKKLGVDTQTGLPPTAATTVGRSSLTSAATTSRGPRRARLQLKHIDPWSTMKFTLVMSVALFVVWMIAVGLLYGVLGGMGVWTKVNDLYDQVAGGNLITASFVLGSAAVIGAINIVLFTALATVGSFVYNLCSDLVGGIELTLSERD
jgi:hypothetical protein